MASFAYYPGCTVKNTARVCESSALAAADALGLELEELDRWTCCGTMFSSGTDELAQHLGSLRNLIRVQESRHDEVITLCAMCHNTLARVNRLVRAEPDRLSRLNDFMDEEPAYRGEVEAVHFLTVLDRLGIERLSALVRRPLGGLRVAPYYGCALLRPAAVGIDDAEAPAIMERLLSALGADVVCDPMRTECCGAYLTVEHPDAVRVRTAAIVDSARQNGAQAITTMCPLCFFNLDSRQDASPRLPVTYFTQLLAFALGRDTHHLPVLT